MCRMKMVVGLGNPGSEYAQTRHNMGFMVIDALGEALGIEVRQRKFGARFGSGEFEDNKLILLKPWQYMNLSGQVVATAVGFYKLPVSDLLVISDDMALEPGRIRVRGQGSAGGHNGLADIIAKLGTHEFARLRVGVGQCGQQDAADYVLARPKDEEVPLLESAVVRARDAVLCWIRRGPDRAMNEYNPEPSE
jgi:PTH1 family peptidyl-tRNA hydrolase